jgi:hypothetical protein
VAVWASGGGSGPVVSVYPDARTLAASPETAITLRGAGTAEVEAVTVTGSRSGPHRGELRRHRDGRGVVFEPERPFTPRSVSRSMPGSTSRAPGSSAAHS